VHPSCSVDDKKIAPVAAGENHARVGQG